MRVKFEGNPITCLHIMAVVLQVYRVSASTCKKKKNEENEGLCEGSNLRNG